MLIYGGDGSGPFLLEKEEDRVLLIKAVLHASDISNPVRPFHVNCVMSTSVHREFRSGSHPLHSALLYLMAYIYIYTWHCHMYTMVCIIHTAAKLVLPCFPFRCVQ